MADDRTWSITLEYRTTPEAVGATVAGQLAGFRSQFDGPGRNGEDRPPPDPSRSQSV